MGGPRKTGAGPRSSFSAPSSPRPPKGGENNRHGGADVKVKTLPAARRLTQSRCAAHWSGPIFTAPGPAQCAPLWSQAPSVTPTVRPPHSSHQRAPVSIRVRRPTPHSPPGSYLPGVRASLPPLSPPLLPLSLLPLLQPQGPPGCSSHLPGPALPQDLCTGCVLWNTPPGTHRAPLHLFQVLDP